MAVDENNKNNMRAHFLVVEDDPACLRYTQSLLIKLEFSYECASNGLQALGLLQESRVGKRFDLVLMDCEMPIMNGIEAARKIRGSDQYFKDIPIVALTSAIERENKLLCKNAGMDGFIPKPLSLSLLIPELMKFPDLDVKNIA